MPVPGQCDPKEVELCRKLWEWKSQRKIQLPPSVLLYVRATLNAELLFDERVSIDNVFLHSRATILADANKALGTSFLSWEPLLQHVVDVHQQAAEVT